MKKIFCCPALELFHCLPLWKTVLFVSSRAFSLSTPVENNEATWKKAKKCNKHPTHKRISIKSSQIKKWQVTMMQVWSVIIQVDYMWSRDRQCLNVSCFKNSNLVSSKQYYVILQFKGFKIHSPQKWYFVTKIVRKKCSSDREKLLKFKAAGRDFAKFLRSQKTVKGQNNLW